MNTIAQITAEALSWINRPSSEMGAQVTKEIFAVINQMQKRVKFAALEDIQNFTVPANTLTITPGVSMMWIHSVELLAASTDTTGTVLPCYSYNEIIQLKKNFQRTNTYPDTFQPQNLPPSDLEFMGNDGPYAFRIANKIGVYPTSTEPRYLRVNYIEKITDSFDVNTGTEFLEMTADYVVLKAVERLNDFLKIEARNQLTAERVKEAWDAVIEWNNQYNSFGKT